MPSKYVLEQELGAGGMGRVYRARLVGEAGFERPVVIKKLLDATDPGLIALFVEEARRYAVLDHENIGRIFDFERIDNDLCIVLEFIDGWSLSEFIDRHLILDKLPPAELVVFIVRRVCRGLQYVYERAAIVHRDISPSNIMMTREGTVKLIDFGIAARSGTRSENLVGKPSYMAPEVIASMHMDNRSDIFSLGSVFYEMLTLDRLFKADSAEATLIGVVAGVMRSPLEVSGILSADGHQWSTAAFATDYLEKSFAGWPRSYPDGMGEDESDALSYSPAGFLWDHALARGVTLRNYGEFCEPKVRWRDPDRGGSPDAAACFRAWRDGGDEVVFGCAPVVRSLVQHSPTGYVGWDMSVPDQSRADFVLRELAECERRGEFPQLVVVCLPNDHTSGTKANCPTPAAPNPKPRLPLPRAPSATGATCPPRSAANWCRFGPRNCAVPRPIWAVWSRSRSARSPRKGWARCRK